jgi:AcrR family transcriptional regulator
MATKKRPPAPPTKKVRVKKAEPAARRDAGRARGEPVEAAVLLRTLEDIAAYGIEQLSVARVARAADVNKTSVYRRWPTREALIAAALERVFIDVQDNIADTGSLRGDLMIVGQLVASFLDSPVGQAVARAALGNAVSPALRALAAQQIGAQASGPFAALVARAMQRGEWRIDAPVDPVPRMLVGALLHGALLEGQALTPAVVGAVVDVIVAGVAPSKT